MSPELTKLLENFNLDNYANLEQLTLADWYTQFIYRLLVGSDYLSYEKAIPQLLNSPLRPQGLFTSLVDARDLTIAEDENDYPDEIDSICGNLEAALSFGMMIAPLFGAIVFSLSGY